MTRFTDRLELHAAITDLTGHPPSVVARVIDGLVATILDRTLAGKPTTVLRLGRFYPINYGGRAKWVPHGGTTTGSVRVLQDRVKIGFRASERTADALRDAGPPKKRS